MEETKLSCSIMSSRLISMKIVWLALFKLLTGRCCINYGKQRLATTVLSWHGVPPATAANYFTSPAPNWHEIKEALEEVQRNPDLVFIQIPNFSFFVSCAPQYKVLSHPSVGGFLTHSRWNSTLKSICMRVPMICWPFFCEQQTNRGFVDHIWKIGLEMPQEVSRESVQALVTRLMNLDDDEVKMIRKNILELRDSATLACEVGGSSYKNMKKFAHQIL